MTIKRIKVAIADGHPLVLCALRTYLEEAGIDVAVAVQEPHGLIEQLRQKPCDLVITAYSMPRSAALDGWRFLSEISTHHPDLPLLVYTDLDDPFLIGSLVQRGVAGIVSRRDDMSDVVLAVRRVAVGGRFLSSSATSALREFNDQPDLRRFASLTRWQMEITGLMMCGLTVRDTAKLLRRGSSTISARRVQAWQSLGFQREADMFRFAAERGLSLERTQCVLS